MPVATLARVRVHPGMGDEFANLLPAFAEHAASEPGTLVYVLNRSEEDPDLFWFAELYRNEESRRAHSASAFVAASLPKMQEYFADLEVLRGTLVAASGVAAE